MITKEDYDVYQYGSSYWAGVNDRILVSGVNDKEFWSDLFQGKGGKGFKKQLDCEENRAILLSFYAQRYPGEPIIRSWLNSVLWKMIISGNDAFIDPHEEPEDLRPRDSLGRIMSPKALQWRDWEVWCNDPQTKTHAILELRRTNAGFAEFYAHQSKLRREEQPVEDAVQSLNDRKPTPKFVPDDVQKFVSDYRTMSTERIKTLLSPGLNPRGPQDAARANKLFSDACALGLI